MQTLTVLCALVLGGMFLLAAIAKFNQSGDIQETLTAFGLSRQHALFFGRLLPWVELATGLLLITPGGTLPGAGFAMLMLVVFTSVIVQNLAKGRRPPCNCFGQMSSATIGWNSVLRNALLIALAALVVVRFSREDAQAPVPFLVDVLRETGGMGVAIALLGLFAVAHALFSVHLLKQNGRLLLLIDNIQRVLDANHIAEPAPAGKVASGLPAGTMAPAFTLPGLAGSVQSLSALRSRGTPVVLIFSDPQCGPCSALMPELDKLAGIWQHRLTFAVVSRGSAEDNLKKTPDLRHIQVLLQQNREVAEQYQVVATPSAALIDTYGLVADSLAMGGPDITAMIDLAARTAPAPVQPFDQPARA